MNKNELKISLLMVMVTVFWAGEFITGKMGVHLMSPLVLTFLRMALAAAIIFPIMIHVEKDNWKIKREDVKYAIATGTVGMIGYHIFGNNVYETEIRRIYNHKMTAIIMN